MADPKRRQAKPAKPKESLVDWIVRTTPPQLAAAKPITRRPTAKKTISVASPRYIPLAVWADQVFGDHSPHANTLLRWVREGRIQPQPKKIGRGYFLVPHAEYVSD